MPLSSNKAQVRNNILGVRIGLSRESLYRKSLSVQRKFLHLDEFKGAGRIALYKSFRSEVLTDDLFATALRDGKELFFPKVGRGGR
ncbi:MAG: hypothetical protein GQ522_01325, partial [Deltaproteobacteria bacterium]|nr:hypothetical protein [Deltaproteobacteria bacterium]